MSVSATHGPAHAVSDHSIGHGAVQHLSHQFEDLDQQNECYIVGMWSFLVTEVMFFGALFAAYLVYRVLYFDAYLSAHHFFSIPMGFANTLVLLTSSLCMALAVNAAQHGKRKVVIGYLTVTTLMACVFLVVKYFEYSAKFHEKLWPGGGFDYAYALKYYEEEHKGEKIEYLTGRTEMPIEEAYTPASAPVPEGQPAAGRLIPKNELTANPWLSQFEALSNHAQLFLCIYFIMTGLHGIHVIIGIICMLVLIYLSSRKHESVEDFMPTEMVGLYWHFVDIVWIFLFPLMYLIS